MCVSCDCAAGYEGLRCENNVNDCANNRCANNSTCVDLIQAYRCDCSPGFMGEYCETKIPFCTKGHDPCENGGRCVDHRTHYSCECPIGFSGLNCSTNLDDCIDHLCQVRKNIKQLKLRLNVNILFLINILVLLYYIDSLIGWFISLFIYCRTVLLASMA